MTMRLAPLLSLTLGALPLLAGTRPVELEVPLPPTLTLRAGARVGFLEVREDGAYTWVHPGGEMINAMRRDLFRAGNLRLVDAPAAPLPEQPFSEIERNAPYMKRVGEKLAADYLLTGETHFSAQDASGYYPAEIERPDGLTETITRYQEMREFRMTFDFYLFDAHTGTLVYKDHFTAKQLLPQGATEDLGGFYLLYDRIKIDLLTLLTPTKRKEIRYLFR